MDGREVKCASGDAGEETMFGGDDVPGEFHGGFGVGVGAVVAFISWDGFDDLLGDAMFVLESGKCNGIEKKSGLFGIHDIGLQIGLGKYTPEGI